MGSLADPARGMAEKLGGLEGIPPPTSSGRNKLTRRPILVVEAAQQETKCFIFLPYKKGF